MEISSRIKTIGDFIDGCDDIADIGADHGLLELYLVAKFENIKILAVENKIGPYKILDRNLSGVKNVKLSLSDGLEAVDENIDVIVIAGMGGLNIRNILDAYPDKVKRLKKIVVDAHRDTDIARKTIVNYGFKINNEKIVYDKGKFYIVMEFLRTENIEKYSEDELRFGYKLYQDKLWPKYSKYLVERNKNIICKIKSKSGEQDKVLKLEELNERLRNYGKN